MKKEQVQRAMEAGRAAAQQAREELERRIAETKAAYQTDTAGTRPMRPSSQRSAVGATPGATPATSAADEEPETA